MAFFEKWRDSSYRKSIYLAQPFILYHTPTEGMCKSYLRDYFDAGRIYTPLDFRKKEKTFFDQLMSQSDLVVGVALEEKYCYSVWQDLDYAESIRKPIFTLTVRTVIGEIGGSYVNLNLIEGMQDFEKLNWDKTRSFYRKMQKKQLKMSLGFDNFF